MGTGSVEGEVRVKAVVWQSTSESLEPPVVVYHPGTWKTHSPKPPSSLALLGRQVLDNPESWFCRGNSTLKATVN